MPRFSTPTSSEFDRRRGRHHSTVFLNFTEVDQHSVRVATIGDVRTVVVKADEVLLETRDHRLRYDGFGDSCVADYGVVFDSLTRWLGYPCPRALLEERTIALRSPFRCAVLDRIVHQGAVYSSSSQQRWTFLAHHSGDHEYQLRRLSWARRGVSPPSYERLGLESDGSSMMLPLVEVLVS